jgi:hypothetical protein
MSPAASVGGDAMTDQELLESFRHEQDGTWTCLKPVMIDGPVHNMAIMPGTRVTYVDMFMGFDLVRKLEALEDARLH